MKYLTSSELENLKDDNLRVLFLKIRAVINTNKRIKKVNSVDLEEYYCYIIREMEKRSLMHHYTENGIIKSHNTTTTK